MSDATERVVNQLLTELDGIEDLEKVRIIAATNRKDLIDPALLRPGRIDSIVELGIPNEEERKEIFNVYVKRMPIEKSVDINDYAKRAESWTGADIEAACRNAGINAIKRVYKSNRKEVLITKDDFDKALQEVALQIGKPLKEIKKEIQKEKVKKVVKKSSKKTKKSKK